MFPVAANWIYWLGIHTVIELPDTFPICRFDASRVEPDVKRGRSVMHKNSLEPSVTILFLGSTLFLISSFVPHLPSWGPFLMPIITIFLSWDLSHSLYMSSNPYTVPCITAGQGIFFASLCLVMDAYSSS